MNSRISKKTQKRMFLLVSRPIFVPLKGTPSWCLHTKPYKFGWNIFPNILHISYRTDLILGEAFCIFVFFHFPDLDFLYWLVCILIFDGMTVKTHNSATLRKSFICIDICHSVSWFYLYWMWIICCIHKVVFQQLKAGKSYFYAVKEV